MPVLKSKYSDVNIPTDLSISDLVLGKVQYFGDKPALIDGITGQQITYRQIIPLVKAVGSGFLRRGFKKGDVVCVLALNCLEYPIVFHAVAAIGGVITTCNPLYTAGELCTQLKASEAKYIVTQAPFLNKVKEAAARSANVKDIYCIGGHGGSVLEFEQLMRDDGSRFRKARVSPKEDVAVLPYSSGTTGVPKGVMLTHYNIIATILELTHPEVPLASENDVYMVFIPLFHIYGIVAIVNIALYVGSTTVILPRFELEHYLSSIEKYKATFLHIVPPVAVLLAKHPAVSKYDLSSVQCVFCGAAPLTAETSKLVERRLKVPQVIQGYGMTENAAGNTVSPREGSKTGSVGRIIPMTQMKVVDTETGTVLGPNQRGEICCRGPQVMKGYLNNERATRQTIDSEGWLRTGDIGYYDTDEDLFIVDRLKELIKYKGFQVPPAELESHLLQHPAIADAAVIGIPDEIAGELPRAYVVLKHGQKATGRDVAKYVEGYIAHYKRLRGGVRIVSEIPKSAAGKILRRTLKEEALKELQSKL